MRSPAILVLTCLLLAGCSEDPTPAAPDDQPEAPDAPSAVPTWTVGDSWAWDAPFGSYTLVVTGETATDYTIETDNAATAWFNEREPISTMGPQRKSDLAGSQGDTRVRFFDWPLEDGKQWATQWDGNDYRMTAVAKPNGRFEMHAHQGDVMRVRYTYDPEVNWFREMVFYDENGTQPLEVTLREHKSGWTGEVVRWSYEVIDEATLTGATAGAPKTYTIPPATDLYLEVDFSCSEPGHVFFALGPAESVPSIATGAESDGYTLNRECPDAVADALVISENPSEGNWGMLHAMSPADARVEYRFLARTQELAPVGA